MGATEPATVRVEWVLEGPRESLATFGWTDLRELVDRITAALEVVPGGPAPSAVLPVAATDGSVRVSMRMAPHHFPAVVVLRKGPAADWTPRQRQRAEALYRWTRARGATLRVGADGEPTEVVQVPTERHGYREAIRLRGQVHRTGGRRGAVEIEFAGEGIVSCRAGKALAAQLGHHLYHTVDVEGVAEMDAFGRLLRLQIVSFEPVVGSAAAAFAALHEAVGTELDEFDPEEALAELRS